MNFDLTDEQRMWRKAVHDFVAREVKPKAHEVDESAQFNWDAVRKMGPLGLLGLNVPEGYGGAGVDAISAAIAIEELGWGVGALPSQYALTMGWGVLQSLYLGQKHKKNVF
jgi:alkylation response protein AidB-like acyl-CoA dehydrogenase